MFMLAGLSGPWVLVLFFCLVVAGVAALRYLTRTTPISSVHAGKRDTCSCKFDSKAQHTLVAPPPIDTKNLPAPDARVVKLLGHVTVADVEKMLRELTGESNATVAGASVKIASRNTYHANLNLAAGYVEEFYRRLAKATGRTIKLSRTEYLKRGRKFFNVIAEMTGETSPEKVLILGSHLDSTAGNTMSAENYAPGADDDGSGTIGLLKVAEALAQLPLGCTVRFCHFTGEEQGLWGSYVYSDLCSKEDGIEVIGMIEMDMIGWCAKPGNRVDVHDDQDRNHSHDLVVALVRNAVRYGLKLNVVDTHNHAVQDRSDHAGFLDHGWKAVLVSEEFTDDGFNPNYHSKNDRVPTLNLPFMVEVVRMIIAGAVELARVK